MTYPLHDPTGLLARLAEVPPAQRVDLREAIAAILEEPYHPALGVDVHPLRGVEKGDDIDVFVAYLPHQWVMTYEVHLRRREGDRPPRIVLLALLTTDEVLGP